MSERVSCGSCFGTGRAGMLSPTTTDCVFRPDPTCLVCEGKGYLGKPSLRKRLANWLNGPEIMTKPLPTFKIIKVRKLNSNTDVKYTIAVDQSNPNRSADKTSLTTYRIR